MADFLSARDDVQRELRTVGLINLVWAIDAQESWAPSDHVLLAVGLYHYGGDGLGRIAIPALAVRSHTAWVKLMRWLGRDAGSQISLRDVLRHEYGHALAHALGRIDRLGRPFGRGACVTAYAETSPDEDFAETFMLFLKSQGRLRGQRHPDVRAKWAAVQRAITAGSRRRLPVEVLCGGCAADVLAWTSRTIRCPACGTPNVLA